MNAPLPKKLLTDKKLINQAAAILRERNHPEKKNALKINPVKVKLERLTDKEDRVKYPPKCVDWWDKQHKNTGQLQVDSQMRHSQQIAQIESADTQIVKAKK